MVRCLEYTEHGSKNRKGMVHQVHLDNKIVRHYADKSCGKRCIVYLTELYISKLSDVAKSKDLFYCKPKAKFNMDEQCWYHNTPIGHNLLGTKLTDMFAETGLNCENICNHSLRATGISRIDNSGVPEKLIMERSGHLSVEGIRSYERTSDAQRQQVSRILSNSAQGNRDSGVDPCSSTSGEQQPEKQVLTRIPPSSASAANHNSTMVLCQQNQQTFSKVMASHADK